jgi:hypothetical protein
MRPVRLLPLVLALVIGLSACAPADLDITPTLMPTATREPTDTPPSTATQAPTVPAPTAEPGAAATPQAEATADTAAADTAADGPITTETLIALVPAQIASGAYNWRRSGDAAPIPNVTGGSALKLPYTEPGGAQAEITVGVFESAEAAQAYYDAVLGRVRTLENAETRDDLPQPNAFGSGTYGSDAVILRGNVYLRVSVPQFSSTAGNPLVPLTRTVNALFDARLSSP